MKQDRNVINFIKHVTSNDYKKADEALAAVVNEKLKLRIAATDKKLATSGNK